MPEDVGSSVPPPPQESLEPDSNAEVVTQANEQLRKRHRFTSFLWLRKAKPDNIKRSEEQESSYAASLLAGTLEAETEDDDFHLVEIDEQPQGTVALDENRDIYRWALLYENQRGATIFSNPYYSHESLLPMDPPAFTIPSSAVSSRRTQPTVSLKNYPLPDGTWRWISQRWMVDMREDGRTQHDGFEYNWFFRSKHWRAEVGPFNSGGWVRRRRWIRLMMRPAETRVYNETEDGNITRRTLETAKYMENGNEASQSLPGKIAYENDGIPSYDDVWRGDEDDWKRCEKVMKDLDTRDPKKLELWARWLGIKDDEVHADKKSNSHSWHLRKQWTEDTGPLPSQAEAADSYSKVVKSVPRSHIISVLRGHLSEIIQLFVFPESRANLISMLKRAGILSELDDNSVRDNLDFWSYQSYLEDITDSRV